MKTISKKLIMIVGVLVLIAGCAGKTADFPPALPEEEASNEITEDPAPALPEKEASNEITEDPAPALPEEEASNEITEDPAPALPEEEASNEITEDPLAPAPEKKAWNETFEKEVLSGHVFVYIHTTRNRQGRKSISRRSIPSSALWANPSLGTAESKNIFGILSLMQDSSRVRDVKEVSEGTGSLIVERGLQLIIGGKRVEMDAVATCQLQGTKPLRFTFDAILPPEDERLNNLAQANPSVRKLQVVYKWGDYPVRDGNRWVLVEILWDVVLQQQGVEKRVWELWELQEIRSVAQGEIDVQVEQREAYAQHVR